MTKEQVHALIFEAEIPKIHAPPPPTKEQKLAEDLSTTATPEEPKEKTTEEQVPERYHNFLDVFTKPMAGQLPLHCEWDLKVRFIPNAPSSISCTPYLLSYVEQVF
jgi:hypothetical protein